MKISESQVGYLSHNLLKRLGTQRRLPDYEAKTSTGTPFNAPLYGAEVWLRENVTQQTADGLIKDLIANQEAMAIQQLKHLGLNIV